MENIIDSPLLRKLQLVCLFPNGMEDSERLKELCLQLLVAFGLDIFAVQPNFLARGVAPRLDSLIVSSLLKFLGMVEVFSANNHQFSEFCR